MGVPDRRHGGAIRTLGQGYDGELPGTRCESRSDARSAVVQAAGCLDGEWGPPPAALGLVLLHALHPVVIDESDISHTRLFHSPRADVFRHDDGHDAFEAE